METKLDKIKEFENWCKNTIAFSQYVNYMSEDDWCIDNDVKYSEMSFYEDLLAKVKELL